MVAAGGQGGENNEPSFGGCDGFFPGLGGKPIVDLAGRLFFGGGGGAGHSNNTIEVAGGNGRGVIVLLTEELAFVGGRLLANGQQGANSSGDGAGGGGAGGTILIRAGSITGEPDLQAFGGDGGDVDNDNQERCFGPGGGGSGGLVLSNQPVAVGLAGGSAGLSRNSRSCGEGTNDATAGQQGRQLLLEEGLPQGDPEGAPVNLLSLTADTILCANEEVELLAVVDNPEADFQWQRLEEGNWVNLTDGESVSGANSNRLVLAPATGRVAEYRLQVIPQSDCYQPLTTQIVAVDEFMLPSANPAFSRSELTVNFSANATSTENYFWFFAPGQTSMEANPSFTFPAEGTYSVNLTVTNDCGSFTYTLEVEVNAPLVAAVLATGRRGCAPFVVRFTDNSTGSVADRLWTFPGAIPNSSTEPNPLVTFPEVGSYTVRLRISNEEMTTEVTVPIEVIAAPGSGFIWEAVDNMVQFRNTSEDVFTYRWDFGDGATSTEPNPIHTYTQRGSYEVTLNVSNGSCAVASARTVTVIVNSTSGVEGPSPITIYPNPARGVINLRGAARSQASLYSLQGQLLQRWRITSDLQLLTLPLPRKAVYVLVVEQEGRRQVFRLLNQE